MRYKKESQTLHNVRLEKLVHGGQCLAVDPDGKRLFVWGGLPGELVDVKVLKNKSSYLEALVLKVREPSPDRVEPKEPASYLSTSPWQIMSFARENRAKQAILQESFEREGLDGITWEDFQAGKKEFGYRNKLEVGFWGDETGIHPAHYVRGTHGKQIIQSNALANESLNRAVSEFIKRLNEVSKTKNFRAGDLKTVILRSSAQKSVVGSLFVKKQLEMADFGLPSGFKGLDIYYSDPKSPASLPSHRLYSFGDIKLTDKVLGKNITYDVLSFFQVNLPVFELALQTIAQEIKDGPSIDLYSGVGTIGLSVGSRVLVESESSNIEMAKINTAGDDTKIIHASSEKALEYITNNQILIVDPPRAGLHKDIIGRILEAKPPKIVYLSCNPATQARDVKLLAQAYGVSLAKGFNFFPRTPHIECLVVLDRL